MKKQLVDRIRYVSLAIILIAILLILTACDLFIGQDKDKTANETIYDTFHEWYLWYDQIPKVDPNDFDSYEALIDAIRFAKDRWSFAGSYAEINNLFQRGEYKGFGAGFMIDYDGQIKITHVYHNSPFGRFGVERGWIVESINGYTVNELDEVNSALSSDAQVEFSLISSEGLAQNLTAAKEAIQINTVLYSTIYEYNAHKVGYVVFDSFLETSKDELNKVFKILSDQNISDLIIDLRYNGGGLNSIAELLIGMVGGDKVNGQTVATILHNDKKSYRDESIFFNYEGIKLNLEQVYFITTKATASASELVINCLDPFMTVKLVGSPTHGKPVGMYILSVEALDLAILPISFKTANSVGYSEYFEGLPVDISQIDDLSHNWGNPEEELFKAALADIIEPVTAATAPLKSEHIGAQKLFQYKGLNQIINAY